MARGTVRELNPSRDAVDYASCGLVLRPTYQEMRRVIPGRSRGYIYTLRNGVDVEGTPCDIDVGYDIVDFATGISSEEGELERIMEKLGPEFDVVPFFKFDSDTLTPDMIPVTEMGELARAHPELEYFLILSKDLGLVYKKGEGDLISFKMYPVVTVDLNEAELIRVRQKQRELYRRLS